MGCTFANCTTKGSDKDIFRYFCNASKQLNGKIWYYIGDTWDVSAIKLIKNFQQGKILRTLGSPNASRIMKRPAQPVKSKPVKGTYASTVESTNAKKTSNIDANVVKILFDIEKLVSEKFEMLKKLSTRVEELPSTEKSDGENIMCSTKLCEEILNDTLNVTSAFGTAVQNISSIRKKYDGTRERELKRIKEIRKAKIAKAIEDERSAIESLDSSTNVNWTTNVSESWADIAGEL
jgi:hypothetical protein